MTPEQQAKIKKEIEINENHINSFPLETETGTKKMKEKFHKQAVQERNAYIEKELTKFKEYQKEAYKELDYYVKEKYPEEKTQEFIKEEENLQKLLQVIPFIDDKISLEMKLGFALILYKLSEGTESSLNIINDSLLEFVNIMKKAKIELTKQSFNYSPFTEQYMETLLQNKEQDNFDNIMQDKFKEIYWECPEIIMHLKRNLVLLIKKNYQKLKEYNKEVSAHLLQKYNLTSENAIDTYQEKRKNLNIAKAQDEFKNLQKFIGKSRNVDDYIEGAPLRSKCFNHLAIKENYQDLTEDEKKVFDKESINLRIQLDVLKEYYNYESIIKDLIARFKKKDESKTKYEAKEKEIIAEEKAREKLYKEYQKASGIGFLAKINPTKQASIKVKIKEQVNKLDKLYEELEELDIDIKIGKYLTEGSSIYDALVASLSSYSYIEKIMVEKFRDVDTDFNLSNYVKRYIEFIYNPHAEFLHKVTVLLDYDIAEVLSEKYALLGIHVDKDEITVDAIDSEIETVNVVSLTNNIKNSNISIDEMNLICDIKKIDYKLEDEIL